MRKGYSSSSSNPSSSVYVWIRQSGSTLNVSVLYLQIDALGTVYYLEIKNLAKVHSEIGVQGAAVRSGYFFVIV